MPSEPSLEKRFQTATELPVSGEPPRPGLFGRERELAQLEALFAAARDGRSGRVALVTGEGGIGKSRLLDEHARRLRENGVLVLEGHCLDPQAGARAYAPIVAILEAASVACEPLRDRGRELAQALQGTRVLGRVEPAAENTSWTLRRAHLFEEVASFLVDVSRRAPIAILLHDLHLADGATRGLVGHLAQTRASAPELDGAGERLWGLVAVSSRDSDASWLLGAAAE